MKTYLSIPLIIATMSFVWLACEDLADPIVEEIEFDRALAPTGLESRIRNQITVELDWNVRNDADHYVVEFSEDSLEFNTIIFTDEVRPDELPYQKTFAGETRYSARVKAVGTDGLAESKWSVVTIETDAENIFLPIAPGNVQETYAILNWPAGSDVTHFVINPGNTERQITAEEIAAGEATLGGLTVATDYTVTIYNGSKRRGTIPFFTTRSANVFPENDLAAVIAEAVDGAELVLAAGNYTTAAVISLNKSLSIVAQDPNNRPVVNVAFDIAAGVADVELADLELVGTNYTTVFNLTTAGVEHNSISISNCKIRDYGRQLIYGNVAAKLGSLTIDNCVVSNFIAGGGDFIDFRQAYVTNVSVTNSTFHNAPNGRDFIRLDAATTYTATGLTSTVLIDHCTFYGVSNTQDRILYVRFDANSLTVKNSIFAATDGYFTNQPATTQPVCSKNNYFNAAGFITPAYVTNAKHDDSGTHTTLDPGFLDPTNGDFTISNQALIDDAIGDPRWR
jgi:hypothetical protein